VLPIFGVPDACTTAIDDICDSCDVDGYPCEDKERETMSGTCNHFGKAAVYLKGVGWIAIVTGVLAVCLAFAACFGCGYLDKVKLSKGKGGGKGGFGKGSWGGEEQGGGWGGGEQPPTGKGGWGGEQYGGKGEAWGQPPQW